jgi:hypothetical protein
MAGSRSDLLQLGPVGLRDQFGPLLPTTDPFEPNQQSLERHSRPLGLLPRLNRLRYFAPILPAPEAPRVSGQSTESRRPEPGRGLPVFFDLHEPFPSPAFWSVLLNVKSLPTSRASKETAYDESRVGFNYQPRDLSILGSNMCRREVRVTALNTSKYPSLVIARYQE